jgi:hypothetical protein
MTAEILAAGATVASVPWTDCNRKPGLDHISVFIAVGAAAPIGSRRKRRYDDFTVPGRA